MSIVDPAERERATEQLRRLVTASAVLTTALFFLAPFAFSATPNRVLQVIFFIGLGVAFALSGWTALLGHRISGIWVPRFRSMELTGEGVPSSRPLPLEEPLATVADLLTSRSPFAPRVDLIARRSGLVFVRRRLGRTPLGRVLITSKRRLHEEERATLQDLLDSDPWNRFVPWADIRRVRIPGALPLKPVRFEFFDGSQLTLWAWNGKAFELERALSKVLRTVGQATWPSSPSREKD